MTRILFSFEKQDPVRYLSHLDILRAFERAIRRAGIPVAFSEGFNPRPRLVFASALALGATSEAEQATLELLEPLGPDDFLDTLNGQLPDGLKVLSASEIPAQGRSPLVALRIAEYRLSCSTVSEMSFDSLREAVTKFLALDQCEVQRVTPKGARKIDIRGKVLSIEPVSIQGSAITLVLRVSIGGEGSVKPTEVIGALEQWLPGLRLVRMHRTHLMPAEKDAGQEN